MRARREPKNKAKKILKGIPKKPQQMFFSRVRPDHPRCRSCCHMDLHVRAYHTRDVVIYRYPVFQVSSKSVQGFRTTVQAVIMLLILNIVSFKSVSLSQFVIITICDFATQSNSLSYFVLCIFNVIFNFYTSLLLHRLRYDAR